MERWTIYCHEHVESGRCYVGLTRYTMLHRWNQHCAQAKHVKDGSRSHFANAIRKYGKEAFSHEVLEVCSDLDVANLAEECWIELLDTRNPEKGFNLARGGAHAPHPMKNPWDRPGYREARTAESRARAVDPDHIAKLQKTQRSRALEPGFREKARSVADKMYQERPELKETHRSNTSALWKDPSFREKMTQIQRELALDPVRNRNVSDAIKPIANSKEGKEARSKSSRAAWADPGFRQAAVDRARLLAKDPEWRAKSAPKNHANSRKTHCWRGHEFTPENTNFIDSSRVCKACCRIRHELRKARLNALSASPDKVNP